MSSPYTLSLSIPEVAEEAAEVQRRDDAIRYEQSRDEGRVRQVLELMRVEDEKNGTDYRNVLAYLAHAKNKREAADWLGLSKDAYGHQYRRASARFRRLWEELEGDEPC